MLMCLSCVQIAHVPLCLTGSWSQIMKPHSTDDLTKANANSESRIRESEYVRLVIRSEPRIAEADNLESQLPARKRSAVWCFKAMIWCSITIIVLLIFVKWGLPFLFEKVFHLTSLMPLCSV